MYTAHYHKLSLFVISPARACSHADRTERRNLKIPHIRNGRNASYNRVKYNPATHNVSGRQGRRYLIALTFLHETLEQALIPEGQIPL